jgi:hypothetical protein
MNDVQCEAEKLKPWKADASGDVAAWIAESQELAKAFVYSPEILAAVQALGELRPINLPEPYLKTAGEKARQRIVAANLRLALPLQE